MKASKTTILILCTIILSIAIFSPFTYASGEYRTTDNLNLRTGNTTEDSIITVMPAGSIVNHVETMDNGWFKVNYKGTIGYASGKYLVIASTDINDSDKIDTDTKTNNNNVEKETLYFITQDLNLRKGPSKDFQIVLAIPKGSHLEYIGSSGDWYKVKYNEEVGYVSSKYVKKGTGYKSKGVLVVNKGHNLSNNFNPGVNPEALNWLNKMIAEAKQEGVNIKSFSDFRTYSYQAELYNKYVNKNGKKLADTYSARPGYSEHQTGLAFDMCGNSPSFSEGFAETKEGMWIANNDHRFGFIISYPKGKEHITGYKYEPWHIRYVGVELSNKIKNSGLTLDEYLGTVKANY